MVTNAFIYILYTIETFIISKFPAYDPPTGISDAFTYMGGKAAGLSCIEPVDTWRAALVIIFAIAAVLATARFFGWAVGKRMRHPDGGHA